MKDVEILAKYLQRKFKGRVEIFSDVNNYSNLRIYLKSKTVQFWVTDGEIEAYVSRVGRESTPKTKFHMADPDFEVKLYVFLIDKAGVKPSRLKAEY